MNESENKKKPLLFKIKIIAGIIIGIFLIIVALLNYSGSNFVSDKIIDSSSFNLTNFGETEYIYNYSPSKEKTTNKLYFILDVGENEIHTIEIKIYTTKEFKIEEDEEHKPVLPNLATYEQKFNQTIKFKLIVIGIAVFTLFAIIIAMMNYGSSESGSDKMTVPSTKFKSTEIDDRNYIFNFDVKIILFI